MGECAELSLHKVLSIIKDTYTQKLDTSLDRG